ncbi:MAG: thioredoxin fold domain-containing protein [Spirochaetota bacterium]|nr:MAG: thioredoxin fold domain-containing protein [Spirochaetota bacterium]
MRHKNWSRMLSFKTFAILLFIFALWSMPKEPTHAKTRKSHASGDTLAIVNGKEIKLKYLKERFESMPERFREEYENDKSGLLDQLIIEMLLIDEARKLGFESKLQDTDKKQKNAKLINMLLSTIATKVVVKEEELIDFYSTNKEKMGDIPFEKVKENIHEYLLSQKQDQEINTYIQELQKRADIVKNQKWIAKQEESGPGGLIKKALGSGMPSIVDLGSNNCIPCKMMKPILDELKDEYRGKANVLVIDIYKHRKIASEYRIRAIPTQIFFDNNGKEVYRHEGFLSKEEIVKKLDEIGDN